eukprot:s225_g52.t1
MAFAFWRLPVDVAALDALPAPAVDSVAPVDFWRLPMPVLFDSPRDEVPEDLSPKSHVAPLATPASDTSTIESLDEVPTPPAPPAVPPRAMATEITDMLTRCKAERFDFEQNLRELEEVQARLRALMVKAGEQERRVVHTARETEGPEDLCNEAESVLPPDVWHGVFWFLDCESLRLASCCRKGFSDAEELWTRLLHSDWGVTDVTMGSIRLYRRWVQRFRQMSSTMEGLKGGCLTGVTGSLSRRRLFEALETLVELGLVRAGLLAFPISLADD